jgi:hypothetical protein
MAQGFKLIKASVWDADILIKHLQPTFRPSPRIPLHAYRSILRALSYFPDLHAREVLRQDARERFEKHNVDSKARLTRRLTKARSYVQCIERANGGNREEILAVLQYAYGQRGRRRRILLSELLQPDEDDLPLDHAELTALLRGNVDNKTRGKSSFVPPAKCKAFIESFRHEIPAELQRGTKRPPKPVLKIPHNIWGRTMPLKRQANFQKEWWALTLEKLYPPLPAHEWDRLRDLSTGKMRIEETIAERKRLNPSPILKDNKSVIEHLLNPARRKNGKLEFTEERGLHVDTATENDRKEPPRANHQRTMRRVYAAVWQASAKMHRNPASKEWIVEWGDKMQPSQYGDFPVATEKDSEFLLKNGWKMPPDSDPAPVSPQKKKPRDAKANGRAAERSVWNTKPAAQELPEFR